MVNKEAKKDAKKEAGKEVLKEGEDKEWVQDDKGPLMKDVKRWLGLIENGQPVC